MLLIAVLQSAQELLMLITIIAVDNILQDDFVAAAARLGAFDFIGGQGRQNAVAEQEIDQSIVWLHQLAQHIMVSS